MCWTYTRGVRSRWAKRRGKCFIRAAFMFHKHAYKFHFGMNCLLLQQTFFSLWFFVVIVVVATAAYFTRMRGCMCPYGCGCGLHTKYCEIKKIRQQNCRIVRIQNSSIMWQMNDFMHKWNVISVNMTQFSVKYNIHMFEMSDSVNLKWHCRISENLSYQFMQCRMHDARCTL